MDRVRIAIIDANNAEQLAFMDNGARDSLHYYDDILHTYLQGSAYTFECKVEKDHPDAQFIQAGNKLSFVWKQMPYHLTIMQTHEDEEYIELTAYACCFELLNETAGDYSASAALTLAQYLAIFLPDNDFVAIGINEVSSYTRQLEWTGESDSILKRIYSLASGFDAEVEIIPTLNADYTLSTILLNFYMKHSDAQQGIGEDRSDVVLRYGVDVEGISRDVDASELYTAILPTGKDGLTLTTYAEQTVYDDNGDVLFTKPANNPAIYAPQARDRYPSNVVAESDRYILLRWDTEYSTQAALYGNALSKLKSICAPKATYEVRGYTELNIGDTVMIVDDGFEPTLYLSARVVEQQVSFTDKSRNETTFDNVTEMVSQIDNSLLTRVQELASQVAQSVAGAQIQYYVSTSPTSLIGGQWSATSPTWTDGSYIWTRTKWTTSGGTVSYSTAACATGATGQQGATGPQGPQGADGKMLHATSSTAGDTAAKTATLSDTLTLTTGATVAVTFTHANTAESPTLNVGDTGATPIRTNGVAYAYWEDGATVTFVYDGTYWQVCSSPVYASTATIGNPAGGNVYIDSNSVDLRDASTLLAQFAQNEIGFYLTALAYGTLAKIRFYDDDTQLVSQDTYLGYFRSNVDNLVLHATKLLLEGSATLAGTLLTFEPTVDSSVADQTAAALSQIEVGCGTDGYKTLDNLLGYTVTSGSGSAQNTYVSVTYDWTVRRNICTIYFEATPKQNISSSTGVLVVPNVPRPYVDNLVMASYDETASANVVGAGRLQRRTNDCVFVLLGPRTKSHLYRCSVTYLTES